ncbi:MAG: TatD family hydrolase [archaeon]|nr:MAG: TatD family hydrolase [archaeon]
MIDSHCHVEQKEYKDQLDSLILKWKKVLKCVVSSSAHPRDMEGTLSIYKKYKSFVHISIGFHPEFIKEINEKDIQKTIDFIKKHKGIIKAVGEIGLDYHWIKEPEFREKQKELFVKLLDLAKELDKPVVIHCWDAAEDTIRILEEKGMKKVLMHLFQDRKFLSKVIENNWYVSIGPLISRSKDIKKIARDVPLNRILLETDSPWFKQEGQEYGEPINVKIALKKVAEVKKLSEQEVEKQTDLNAKEFFNL